MEHFGNLAQFGLYGKPDPSPLRACGSVTNPTQQLSFDFTAGSRCQHGNLGTFELQVGSFKTEAIHSTPTPTVTAVEHSKRLAGGRFSGRGGVRRRARLGQPRVLSTST